MTATAFDDTARGMSPKMGASSPRIIWTLPAIGQRIGVGVDFVRDTIAKQPGTPIREIGGRYYAFEDDLISFLRLQKGNGDADAA